MKAIRVAAPAGLDNLHLVDLPEPAAPGPGEITVRIRASSLNYHDYAVVSGMIPSAEGRIPMSDGAGTVEAIGPGVTEFAVGDSVVSCFFTNWLDGPPTAADFSRVPGDGIDGYAREAVTCPAGYFTPAPRGFTHAEAATLTTAGLTAWRAMMCEVVVQPGETVLVQGSGGVSVFALQLARAAGARVFATSSSDEKLERLRALGAEQGINYRTDPAWHERVLEFTDGRGVDHVIEVGGPATIAQSMACCRVGGHIPIIGVLSGFAGPVPFVTIINRQQTLRGIAVGSRVQQLEMVTAIDTLGIRPVVDSHFPLAEIAGAFRHEAEGRHFGKICLDI